MTLSATTKPSHSARHEKRLLSSFDVRNYRQLGIHAPSRTLIGFGRHVSAVKTNVVRNRKSCETKKESFGRIIGDRWRSSQTSSPPAVAAQWKRNCTTSWRLRSFHFYFLPDSIETENGEIFETIAKLRPQSFASSAVTIKLVSVQLNGFQLIKRAGLS